MNPPFGTRRAGIDVIFLERALEVFDFVVLPIVLLSGLLLACPLPERRATMG